MIGGFSFCGVDIDTLGLEYAPDNSNTYVYKPSLWNTDEDSFESHDGGYFYGTSVRPKDFSLRCIYQDTHVGHGGMTKLFHLFSRGKTGRLIFQKRPWCWYTATVASVDISQMRNYMNGIVTINLRAYYPFARQDKTYITEEDATTPLWPGGPTWKEDLTWNSAMLEDIGWDLQKDYANPVPITAQNPNPFLIYNAGTENAPCAIEIGGNVGRGITIANRTTGQKCEIVGLNTTGTNDYIIVDALSGKVLNSDGKTFAFLYHDNGFIDLESGYPLGEKVHVQGTQSSSTLVLDKPLGGSEIVGERINMFVAGSSAALGIAILGTMNLDNEGQGYNLQATIRTVSDDGLTLTIDTPLATNISTDAQLVRFNEIVVTPKVQGDPDVNITRLVFKYRPTFA